jgi:hypothetical protein
MGAGTPAAGIPATFSLRQGILCVSVSLAKRVVKVLTRLFMLFSDSALARFATSMSEALKLSVCAYFRAF